MSKFQTIYLNGEYLVITNDYYIIEKYEYLSTFILYNTIENIYGCDWINSNSLELDTFKKRLIKSERNISTINEPILYGRIKTKGSPFLFPELLLLSEIAFNKSLDEFDLLKKFKKITELKIKN